MLLWREVEEECQADKGKYKEEALQSNIQITLGYIITSSSGISRICDPRRPPVHTAQIGAKGAGRKG